MGDDTRPVGHHDITHEILIARNDFREISLDQTGISSTDLFAAPDSLGVRSSIQAASKTSDA